MVKDRAYIGSYVPQELSGHLILYTLFYGTSRAALIEDFLTKTLSTAPPPEQLCDSLAEKLFYQWGYRGKVRFITRYLARKKLPPKYVERILHRMKELDDNGTDEQTTTV